MKQILRYFGLLIIALSVINLSLATRALAQASGYKRGDTSKCVNGAAVADPAPEFTGNYEVWGRAFCSSVGTTYDPAGINLCDNGQGIDFTNLDQVIANGGNVQSFSISYCKSIGSAYSAPIVAPPTPGPRDNAPDNSTVFSSNKLNSDCKEKDGPLTKDNCKIVGYFIRIINVLSGLVGIVVTIMIIIGAIQYSASKGDPSAAAAAKKRIFNAILAMVMFIFMYSFLQWVVPGGIF